MFKKSVSTSNFRLYRIMYFDIMFSVLLRVLDLGSVSRNYPRTKICPKTKIYHKIFSMLFHKTPIAYDCLNFKITNVCLKAKHNMATACILIQRRMRGLIRVQVTLRFFILVLPLMQRKNSL